MATKTTRQRRRRVTSKRRRLFVEPLEARLCLAAVPAFSSLPGADHTIYLDFDGHVTTGTTWNSNYGVNTINSPAYDIDGDPNTFNSTELSRIEAAYKWIAEDFSPFEVNVTTVDPGAAALSYQGGGDTQWGTRVVITDDTFANCGCGGHAFLGSFDDSQDEPVFVYNTSLKGVSEASTHEVGHALLLSHDGYSGGTYYWGHGSGATSWAPLMGASYNQNVTQFSQGEYYTANQSQDDLAIISSLTNGNGFGYKADDHGDSNGAATNLSSSGGSIDASGIIETTSDVDVLTFNTGAGAVSIDIDPAAVGPNLDIKADLYDSGGSLVASSNSTSVLDASFNLTLAAGQYYIHIDGVGTGDPFSATPTGYTEYGSLGQYSVSGTVVDPGGLPSLTINDVTVDEGAGTAIFTVTLAGMVTSPVSVDFATADGSATGGSDYTGTSGSLSFSAAGTDTITVSISDDVVTEGSENFVVNLSNASGAAISDGQGVGTINDNDADLSIDDVSSNEGNLAKGKKNSGNPQLKDFVFTITLSNVVSHAVTVDYTTADGTATTADGDYQSASGSITFLSGQTSKSVTVVVVGDNNDQEGDEDFTVQLSNAQGANLADATGTGTILDDDAKSGGGGGGGGNGGGGGCNGNGNKPGCGAEEIEMQDPIWWFEGPDSEHSHFHDPHDHLPHETESLSAVVAIVNANSNSYLNDRPLRDLDQPASETELFDRAIADLTAVPLSESADSTTRRNFDSIDSQSDSDEPSLDTELFDSPLDLLLAELT